MRVDATTCDNSLMEYSMSEDFLKIRYYNPVPLKLDMRL